MLILSMVTIVITNYNNQESLVTAINSCLSQDYPNIKIRIVDDCSIDNSWKICQEYASGFPDKISITRNVINIGAGKSRNVGIKLVDTPYLMLLDSDDYLESSHVSSLISFIEKENLDYAIGDKTIIWKGEKYIENYPLAVLDSTEAIIKNVIMGKEPWTKWFNGAIMKTSLWENYDYCPRRYKEDTSTLVGILMRCSRVGHLNTPTYYYSKDNPESLTSTATKVKNMIYGILVLIDTHNRLIPHGYKLEMRRIMPFIEVLKNIKEEDLKGYEAELSEIFMFLLKNTEMKM